MSVLLTTLLSALLPVGVEGIKQVIRSEERRVGKEC